MEDDDIISEGRVRHAVDYVYSTVSTNEDYIGAKTKRFIARCHDHDHTESGEYITVGAVRRIAYEVLDSQTERVLKSTLGITDRA